MLFYSSTWHRNLAKKCVETYIVGWVNVQKVFKIMPPPQNPIILVPKVSPSEKLKKKIYARGCTKRSEVYALCLCSDHLPKISFGLKTMLSKHFVTRTFEIMIQKCSNIQKNKFGSTLYIHRVHQNGQNFILCLSRSITAHLEKNIC